MVRVNDHSPLTIHHSLLLILLAYLAVWVPLNFAVEASGVLTTLGQRGGVAVIEILVHGAVAVLCVGAAFLLRREPEGAVNVAAAAVVASAIVGVQSQYATTLPRQTAPGQHLPIAAAYVLNGFFWVWYLRRRARSSR